MNMEEQGRNLLTRGDWILRPTTSLLIFGKNILPKLAKPSLLFLKKGKIYLKTMQKECFYFETICPLIIQKLFCVTDFERQCLISLDETFIA